MKFDAEFFRFFTGMVFDPKKDEFLYLYYQLDDNKIKAIEEEHVRFRTVLGNVLVIETLYESETGEAWWESEFIPLESITDFHVNMSWDELLEKTG